MERRAVEWLHGMLRMGLIAAAVAATYWVLPALSHRTGAVFLALIVAMALLSLSARRACAEPRTMYRPADIENARRNADRFAWAREVIDGWRADAAFALSKDRAFFEALIPDLTPGTTYGQNCPHCVGKQSLMGSGRFHWRVEEPDRVSCAVCGTTYPHPDYPETGVLACPRMGQTFTYYETPEEKADPANRNEHALKWLGDRPTMTTFSGLIRFFKARWAWSEALSLAKLYALTGDAACAERVIWILDRFARVYPYYLYHSYDGTVADWPPADVAANMGREESAGGPRGGRFPKDAIRHAYGLHQEEDYATLNNGFWGAGRLSCHGKGSDAGPLFQMTVAYDLVRDARDADGARLMDEETERRIVDDLILAGCTDMKHWDSLSNKGTAVFVLSAAVGMRFEEPGRVHQAIDGFQRMLEKRYHFDGHYAESPGYAAHNLHNVSELPDLLVGYSDPPGYRADDGRRIDDYSPFAEGRYNLALQAMVRMLVPGNRLPSLGDTVFDTGPSMPVVETLAARLGGYHAGVLEALQGAGLSEKGGEYDLWFRRSDLLSPGPVALPLHTEWFPGWHVGILRGGQPDSTALCINGNEHHWTRHTGHRQQDILSLSFYAFGEELVPDLGYFSGSSQRLPDGRSGQEWARSTLSHNLVIVDDAEQEARDCGSNLELFGIAPGVEVLQASGANVYPQCDTYRRTSALLRGPDGHPVVLDIFRVSGGRQHQYRFVANGQMVHPPRTEPADLSAAWAKWVLDPRAVASGEPHAFNWAYRGITTELRLLNGPESLHRVLIADAPGWRRFTPEQLANPPIQQVTAERVAGDAGALASQFAALLVPHRGESPVRDARVIDSDAESGFIAIEVRFDGRTDYVLSSCDQEERTVGPVTAAGEFASVSVDDRGQALRGYLLKGSRLRCGDLRIDLPAPATTHRVRSVEGRTFHLSEDAPARSISPGNYLLVGHDPRTGLEVESVTGNSITVRDYPAVETADVEVLNSGWWERR